MGMRGRRPLNCGRETSIVRYPVYWDWFVVIIVSSRLAECSNYS